MSKAAYKHESEQKISFNYFRKITELYEKYLDDPWTNDFTKGVQALIDAKLDDKKIILKMKAKVLRGEKE